MAISQLIQAFRGLVVLCLFIVSHIMTPPCDVPQYACRIVVEQTRIRITSVAEASSLFQSVSKTSPDTSTFRLLKSTPSSFARG
jgi:hypothetical protein